MMKSVLAAVVFALSFSSYAFADDQQGSESKSSIKIDDAAQQKNKVSGDIDEEITNAKLRAESGSKSRWSGSFTATYQGSSLEHPFDKDRANPTGLKVPERVKMAGDMGVRYRMDKNQSIELGTGYSIERPLQEAKYGDVSDPYASYNYAKKIGGTQSISQVIVGATTNSDELTVGQKAQGSLLETLMYDFGGSKLSTGLALEADYNYFTGSKDAMTHLHGQTKDQAAGNFRTDYALAAYPLIEYALSDRVQLRTVFRPWIYQHSVFDKGFTFAKSDWTQSIGIGFAVTRDIYLYPNFQYSWEDWRGDDFNWFRKQTRSNSTVSLAATINVF